MRNPSSKAGPIDRPAERGQRVGEDLAGVRPGVHGVVRGRTACRGTRTSARSWHGRSDDDVRRTRPVGSPGVRRRSGHRRRRRRARSCRSCSPSRSSSPGPPPDSTTRPASGPIDFVVRPGPDPIARRLAGRLDQHRRGHEPGRGLDGVPRRPAPITDGPAVLLTILGVSGAQVHEVHRRPAPVAASSGLDDGRPTRCRVLSRSAPTTSPPSPAAPTFRRRYRRDGRPPSRRRPPTPRSSSSASPTWAPPRGCPVPLRQIAGRPRRAARRRHRLHRRRRGLHHVDLAERTSGIFSSDPDRYFSGDDFHPSPDGHEVWADADRRLDPQSGAGTALDSLGAVTLAHPLARPSALHRGPRAPASPVLDAAPTTICCCSSTRTSTRWASGPTWSTCWCRRRRWVPSWSETDRGGDVTYHGPGQLVGYPILTVPGQAGRGHGRHGRLRHARSNSSSSTRSAELGLADAGRLARLPRRVGRPRVGRTPARSAAIGVKLNRGRSMHGFALNVDPDMDVLRPTSSRAASPTRRSRRWSARRASTSRCKRSSTSSPAWRPSGGAQCRDRASRRRVAGSRRADLAPVQSGRGPGRSRGS